VSIKWKKNVNDDLSYSQTLPDWDRQMQRQTYAERR